MLFNSYIFVLLFLPVSLLGYFFLNSLNYSSLAQIFLLGMSLWFYGYFNIKYLFIIVISIVFNFTIYKLLFFLQQNYFRKLILIIAIIFNIGLLFYFKYYDFFVENINLIFHSNFLFKNLMLPLGISFFSFQQLSFVIDSFKKDVPSYNFLNYALFVTYFPQLIAGPIVTHEELVPQFADNKKRKVNWENVSKGLYIFVLGMAKKVLIADTFGNAANWGFENIIELDSISAYITMLSYTIQIYFDFSGYCDMAYGIGQMFGIELPFNFYSPYKAESISDFWDRWHITLTKFFTKYIYIPLGGSRKGKIRTYLNTLFVFFISGLWHGANWTFVLWGILNGVLMVLERIFKSALQKIPKAVRRGVTFIIVVFLWSIFRVPEVAHEKLLLKQIGQWQFGPVNQTFVEYFNELTEVRLLGRLGIQGIIDAYPAVLLLAFLAVLLLAVWFFKNTEEQTAALQFENTKRYGWKMAEAVLLLTWSILSLSNISEFIYFNF